MSGLMPWGSHRLFRSLSFSHSLLSISVSIPLFRPCFDHPPQPTLDLSNWRPYQSEDSCSDSLAPLFLFGLPPFSLPRLPSRWLIWFAYVIHVPPRVTVVARVHAFSVYVVTALYAINFRPCAVLFASAANNPVHSCESASRDFLPYLRFVPDRKSPVLFLSVLAESRSSPLHASPGGKSRKLPAANYQGKRIGRHFTIALSISWWKCVIRKGAIA